MRETEASSKLINMHNRPVLNSCKTGGAGRVSVFCYHRTDNCIEYVAHDQFLQRWIKYFLVATQLRWSQLQWSHKFLLLLFLTLTKAFKASCFARTHTIVKVIKKPISFTFPLNHCRDLLYEWHFSTPSTASLLSCNSWTRNYFFDSHFLPSLLLPCAPFPLFHIQEKEKSRAGFLLQDDGNIWRALECSQTHYSCPRAVVSNLFQWRKK